MITADVEKRLRAYDGERVLRINHAFRKGSITSISGPSGAGKTTLLKIIAGFVEPDRGVITAGADTWLDTGSGLSMPARKRMAGFVFQDYALFPNMTVRQHLEYATDDQSWIGELLITGQLESFVKHKPVHLSGGQQQRLAILRALAIKPKLLLMDEPFSALDPDIKATLITALKAIFSQLGTTVLIVTHYPQELKKMADSELLFH